MRLIADGIERRKEHSAQERVLRQIRHSRLMSQRMKQGKREDKVNRYVNEFIVRKEFKRRNLLARNARLHENPNSTQHRRKLIEPKGFHHVLKTGFGLIELGNVALISAPEHAISICRNEFIEFFPQFRLEKS